MGKKGSNKGISDTKKSVPLILNLKWANSSNRLFSNLGQFFNNQELCNVSILCNDDQSICGHKVILSCYSPVLREYISNGNSEIDLSHCEAGHMSKVFQLMYQGGVEIEKHEMTPLLNLCQHLKISGLYFDGENGPEDGEILVHEPDDLNDCEASPAKKLKLTPRTIKTEDDNDNQNVEWKLEEQPTQKEVATDQPSQSLQKSEPRMVSLANDYTGISQSPDGTWKCLDCGGKTFASKNVAQTHLQLIHRSEEQVKGECHLCQKVFPNLTYLKKHLGRTHKLKSGRGSKREQ